MGTAIVYILSSITLALILVLTRSSGHSVIEGEDVFRYRPKLLKVAYGCSFLPVVCATFICVAASPRPGVLVVTLLMSVALVASALMLWAWKRLKSYEVRIQPDGLLITKFGKTSELPFSQIHKVIYLKSSSGGGTVELYGPNKRSLFEFTDTMEDIDQLAKLIVSQARGHRVECLVTQSRPLGV